LGEYQNPKYFSNSIYHQKNSDAIMLSVKYVKLRVSSPSFGKKLGTKSKLRMKKTRCPPKGLFSTYIWFSHKFHSLQGLGFRFFIQSTLAKIQFIKACELMINGTQFVQFPISLYWGWMKQPFDNQTRPERHDDFTDNYHSTWAGSVARCLIIIIFFVIYFWQ
jgi:hypothetical protein